MNCETCSLYNFIKVVTTNDTSFVGGNANWEAISEEYAELSGSTKSVQLLDCLKDVSYYGNKLYLVEQIVNNWHPALIAELHIMGFKFEYKDNLQHDLEMTIIHAKTDLLEWQERKAELEELQKNNDKQITEMEFLTQIEAYGESIGTAIDIHTTNVKRYIAIQLYIASKQKA